MFSLLLLLDFALEILEFVDVLFSGVDFEVLQYAHLLENSLHEVLEISLGDSDSGGDHDLFGAYKSNLNVVSQNSLLAVDFDVSSEVVHDLFRVDQLVVDGDSEIDGELGDLVKLWVFEDLSAHRL